MAHKASYSYNNGHHFGSHGPTRVRRFENRASCADYPDDQANYQIFQRKVPKDVTAGQLSTSVTPYVTKSLIMIIRLLSKH
jgi:hypothetical protein